VFLFFILILLFALMGGRLFFLQIMESDEYGRIAADQRERDVAFPARRGAIFDRSGEPLAISVDLNMIFADPAHIEDPDAVARKLAPALDEDPTELAATLRGHFPGDRFEYLARQVSPKIARQVEALALPGIYLRPEPKRFYPGGRLASHVLGFVNIDGTVRAGAESQYQGVLEGAPGRMILEQDPSGRPLPQAEFSFDAPVPGRSLFLTIDKQLQYFTELTLSDAVKRYRAKAGTAVIMRPDNGEILAVANVPDFDPNRPGASEQDAHRNRALTDIYEPGSAFKIVTASAAIEEGVVTPKTRFVVPDAFQVADRILNDSHSHPTENMTVRQIIEESSNVGTIKIGLELGGERLDRYVRKFGFGRKTGLDFPGESAGIVIPRKLWSGSTIATIPIGQGVAVTPIQMAAAYATIANDGVWVEPKLLHSTMGASGRMQRSATPATRRVVSKSTARQMSRILEGVVSDGTGIEALIPGYRVAGKTGTAQKPIPGGGGYGDEYMASFAGFAPANDPQIVVLVILDDPSPIWGGTTAAPTFRTITEYALRHLGASPSGNAEKAAREIEEAQAKVPAAHD
jgi:cell division protein FtsI (penicillin-binding protein 3)